MASNNLKVFPGPLIHHRPTDSILFEPVAIVKYLLSLKLQTQTLCTFNFRLEAALKKVVGYFERFGCLKKDQEEAIELVNQINKNFSTVKYIYYIHFFYLFIIYCFIILSISIFYRN